MKLIFAAGLALAVVALPAARAASAPAGTNASPNDAMTALFGDPVIVKGKGFQIKRSELDEVVTGVKSAFAAHGQAVPPAQLPRIQGQLLDRLVQVQLLLQKATAADRSNGVAKADLQLKTLLERAGSQDVLDRQLQAVGMTQPELRAKVTQENTAQSVLTRELNVSVSDTDAKKFYDGHPADFEQPEMVHARHILLMTIDPVTHAPLSDDQQKAKEKLAEDLLQRIRGGADFATLAKQYSEDPGSKENGGDLPPFARGQMVPEFEAAAFSLTNNQVSDIVKSAYGYHIIKLIEKLPAKTIDYASAAPKIKDYLIQQQTEKLAPPYLEKVKKAAGVEILDPELKADVEAAAAAAAMTPDASDSAPADPEK